MALFTLTALFLSFDFAVISAGLLIHAFVASNDQVKNLRAAVPRGTVLNINRNDITTAGQVSTAVQALIIGLTTASALAVLFRSKIRPKFFVILGSLLAFASLWLLSVTIAFTVIFATRSARVSASLGGIQLPQAVISAQARALGVSPVYKDQPYLLHAAILPWFAWLFTTVAAAAMFSESRAESTSGPRDESTHDKSPTSARDRTPSIV
ncbi:hypothetical protein BJ322DRAFT_1106470 [Thelephora terrestris]|uniref:Uncharacterized protein n=1 Tax=Thelephora terrestris TaxID=56493 RepID=A0A9P6L9V9_9AGAM|nr:hypothetical protein BJ322DRAFT_1106470 [Thelephora terrestris]